MDPQFVAHDMRSLGESRVHVAIGDFIGDDAIIAELAAHRRGALDPGIGRRRQYVVIDGDEGCGVLGDIAIFGHDNRDRLADEGHFAVGERERPALIELGAGIRGPHHAPLLQHRRQIIEREHRDHARQRPGGAGIDASDQRMRMRAARESGDQNAGRGDVVDEAAFAGQERTVFNAQDARSDQFAHWWALDRPMTSPVWPQ